MSRLKIYGTDLQVSHTRRDLALGHLGPLVILEDIVSHLSTTTILYCRHYRISTLRHLFYRLRPRLTFRALGVLLHSSDEGVYDIYLIISN